MLSVKNCTFSRRKKAKCSESVRRSNRILCCGQMPRLVRILSVSVRILYPLMVADPLVGENRPVCSFCVCVCVCVCVCSTIIFIMCMCAYVWVCVYMCMCEYVYVFKFNKSLHVGTC